jgi:hypothetical protein
VASYTLSRAYLVLWRWTIQYAAGEQGPSGLALTRVAARLAARSRMRAARARRRAAEAAQKAHANNRSLAA